MQLLWLLITIAFPEILKNHVRMKALILRLKSKYSGVTDYKKNLLNRTFFCFVSIFDIFPGKLLFQDYIAFSDTCSLVKIQKVALIYVWYFSCISSSTCTVYQHYSCQDSHRNKHQILIWGSLNVSDLSFFWNRNSSFAFAPMFLWGPNTRNIIPQ